MSQTIEYQVKAYQLATNLSNETGIDYILNQSCVDDSIHVVNNQTNLSVCNINVECKIDLYTSNKEIVSIIESN